MIPALQRQRLEDQEFKVILSDLAGLYAEPEVPRRTKSNRRLISTLQEPVVCQGLAAG